MAVSGNGTFKMTIRFSVRLSASMGVILPWRLAERASQGSGCSEGGLDHHPAVTIRHNPKFVRNWICNNRPHAFGQRSNKREKMTNMRTYFAAALAMMSATPALADTTLASGPVTVQIGGFLASEGVYRSRSTTADIGSNFTQIPWGSQPNAHYSETRFTARQSRLTVMATGNVDSDTHLTFWNEMDFLGNAQTGNSNESNSYNLRIRNMYTTVDWDSLGLEVLAGQNWSLATANTHGITPRNELVPATIEAQYVVGFNWARQPQLRVVKNWNKEFWVAVSIENPQTTFAANSAAASGITPVVNHTGGGLLYNGTNFSLNHIPDVIGKVAWEPYMDGAQPLHVEVYGLYRDFYDRIYTAAGNAIGFPASNQNADRAGGGVGGSIVWNAIPKLLDLQATALTGSGIGRYGSAQLPDVTYRPDGTLAPIQRNHLDGGRHLACHPAPGHLWLWRPGSAARQDLPGRRRDLGPGQSRPSIWRRASWWTAPVVPARPISRRQTKSMPASGGESTRASSAASASAPSIPTLHLTAFGGAGGIKPTTDDSMVFTSIRYYPF